MRHHLYLITDNYVSVLLLIIIIVVQVKYEGNVLVLLPIVIIAIVEKYEGHFHDVRRDFCFRISCE